MPKTKTHKNLKIKGEKMPKRGITGLTIVLMNILAILGIRWFMFAAKYGAASVLMWIIAAVLFFIPTAFICAEFGAMHPNKEAALTDWIKEELGEGFAFFASWFYLITQFFYLPTLLTFIGVCIAYAINPNLAESKLFITLFIIIVFWGMLFLSTKNLEIFKKISEFNCFVGVLLPIFLLITAAIISVFFLKHKIPTDFSAHNWIPRFTSENLLFIIGISTGMAGAEVSAPFIAKMQNPRKDFPLAILFSAVCIILCYIVGTLSIIFVIAPSDFNTVDGMFKAIQFVFAEIRLGSIAMIMFLLTAIGSLGAMILWLVSPTKMFIDGNDPKIFPKFITKKTKDNLPLNAMIIEGFFITIIVLLGNLLPSVNALYNVLVIASSILMFITYILLVMAYLKMKFTKRNITIFEIPGKRVGAVIASILILAICAISIVIPIISIPSGNNIFLYELEVIGGPIILFMIGYWLYQRKKELPTEN